MVNPQPGVAEWWWYPRRCVDFQQLNKVSLRQTHPVKTPFHQAMSIPPNTYRSCLDAYEGFHSIPLREEDRHLTTFITEYGRYTYRVLPQGFLAATQGPRAGRGFYELNQEVRHRQGGWGHSLDHPPCSDKSQNSGFWRKSIILFLGGP